jgi:hypothetical protein
MLTIEKVEEIAKDVLVSTGRHNQQLLVEIPATATTPSSIIPILLSVSEDEVDRLIVTLKLFVKFMQVERYFFISEVWASQNVFERPRDSPDKREVLVVCEFRRDNNNRNIMIDFRHEGKEIIFGKRLDTGVQKQLESHSRYNFFLEDFTDGGYKDKLMRDKSIENIDFVMREMKMRLGGVLGLMEERGITEEVLRRAMVNMVNKGKLLIDKDNRRIYTNGGKEDGI